jgi:SnoaL-like protein
MRRQILALLGTALLTVGASTASADTDAHKLATVRQMIEAWNTRNWQQVYDLFAADGVLQSMMLPEPTVGREAISQRIGSLAQDISKIELRIRHIGVADGLADDRGDGIEAGFRRREAARVS